MQTQFDFTLPRGYLDGEGKVQRTGTMRLATALDEIEPLRDLRVQHNSAYLPVILFARVIVRLGDLPGVTTQVLENLFASDMAYLQTFYQQINEHGSTLIQAHCPACQGKIAVNLARPGEAVTLAPP